MRATLLFVSIAGLFLSACSTGNKMHSTATTDDLYVAKTGSGNQVAGTYTDGETSEMYTDDQMNPDPDYVTTEKYTDENGTNYITNNYYEGQNYDFYGSDYSYTSDLNRWYGPSVGFSYFSPFYAMPGFGVSIGFGYGWGYPGYYPYYSSFYNPYYYNPWYSPYYYGYYPYYGGGCYGGGYYGGGYCGGGYYDGYGYGYGNDVYYGSHGSASSNTSGNGNGRSYKTDDNVTGDGQGTTGSAGRSLIPVSLDQSNELIDSESPVRVTSPGGTADIKRNTTLQNNSVTGAGSIKDLPGRNTTAPVIDKEIKSVIPPVRTNDQQNASPRQNMDENRPRINASSSEFETQRKANAAINAVNNPNSSTHTAEAMESLGLSNTGVSRIENNYEPNIVRKSTSGSLYSKGAANDQKKQGALMPDKQLLKSNHPSGVKVQSERDPSPNVNATGRSYNQNNSTRSSSGGSSRSTNNRQPR